MKPLEGAVDVALAPTGGNGAAIVVSDLFCLYPVPGGATVAAVRGLSLRVPRGERLVVHGPNGSGKTTLLRVLAGEVAPSAGSVSVAGREACPDAGREFRRSGPGGAVALRREALGLIDQHSGRTLRPELSVLDNVALQLRLAGVTRRAARAAATAALAGLGLEHFAARRPPMLSVGEAQRVAVCAAIAHRPAVLLADEPTGELDLAAADAVYDLLAAATRQAGATLVLVTHDLRAARVADRVVRIRDGRLSEQWDPLTPQDEELVIDDRGWLRLPEPLRRRLPVAERVRVHERDGGLVLVPPPDRPAPPDPPVIADLPGPLEPATGALAAVAGLDVAHGDRVVLSGFNADFAAGTLTVVRGRSGAGKSTLLRLLLGLADPDAGTVTLGGHSLAGCDRAARADLRRAYVGVSTQAGALAESLDARENLRLARAARGLPAADDLVETVLARLELAALAARAVRLLSGGERQRVVLARSLVVQRPFVVLDEPTSQQDEAHAELVTAVLVAAARAGAGIVCATHDPILARAAGAVIELA